MESILTLISGSHDDKNNQPSPYRPLHLTDVHGVLTSEPKSATCIRLAEVTGISHDNVNRFLLREAYESKDLFNEAKFALNLVGGR